MATLSRVTVDGTTHIIASSAYGYCTNDADTAAKVVTIQDGQNFYRTNGATVHIYFLNQNTADSPTLNVGGTGAKPIYAYSVDGSTTVKPTWPAKSMISFTYNGSADSNGCWSMNDPVNGRSAIYEMAYNTTVNASEVLEAINSKKQIVVRKSATYDFTNGFVFGALQEYTVDTNTETLATLIFYDIWGNHSTLYSWSSTDGWSTNTQYLAEKDHASTGTGYGLGDASKYGHLKLSNSYTSTSGVDGGIAATPSAVKAAYDLANTKAPTSHASTGTTYGKGTSSNYGHVKLSDSVSSTSSAASGGIAATPSAVKAAYDLADTANGAASAVQTALDQTSFVQVTVPNGSKKITFPASTGTRGVLFMDGYSNGTKAVYMITCTTSGVVATVAVLSGSNYTLTTGTRTLTIANNSTASTGYGVLMLFAGSATVS